ncbi:hypothetical protein [Campylobacter jejuni]|uniref:hypothetical protein n=1 Tax=Campylobacter jejuni TaxID=197 RepID=UPI000F7FD60D|nr:hypothetical protein [Campylobacter jejuni]EAH8023713.1 hypothetical protein [Campylobacter jejuni]ECQ5913049.1 hypothetical protein [Campylobacter jejuni]EDP5801870.1 hypothetical protein [Campylobacter jejuni]RTJ21863.1 hypothetical protein C3H86_08970 [Campylobacter jejuni]RTJ49581.1 hypothetical protein C3H69_08435 [Campylobacter jejuni]
MEKNYEDFKEALLKGNLALVLTSVSKSGMTHTFKVFYKNKKEQYLPIPDEIAKAVSDRKVDEKGIAIRGYGMDMSFALWLNIASYLKCYNEAYRNYSSYKPNRGNFNPFYPNMETFINEITKNQSID